MTWYAHLWLLLSTIVGIALLVVLAWQLGGIPLVFAVVVAGLTIWLSRQWLKRRTASR